MDLAGVIMDDANKIHIDDYLRLVQQNELGFNEICEIIQVQPEKMRLLLCSPKYTQYIKEKAMEFKMTAVEQWHTIDKYIKEDGFDDEFIAYLLNMPIQQIAFRRHFLTKHLI